jgi:hypothetical protein
MSIESSRHGTHELLGIGATYQTPFLKIERYEGINIVLNTDVDGTLYIEYSTDGVNVDYTNEDVISGTKLNGTFNCFKVISRFARIRYLNGAVAQSTFRLQITLKERQGHFANSTSIEALSIEDGVIDTLNASRTPLGISGIYTGDFVEVTPFSTYSVFLKSDTDGILKIQFSADGIVADKTKVINIEPSTGVGNHILTVISRYMRIVFENGTVAQTAFTLQCILHKLRNSTLTRTTDRPLGPNADVEAIRIVNDIKTDVALNRISDQSVNNFFGTNPNIGTIEEDIWGMGGLYNWLATATTLEIDSNDLNDDATGLGAQLVVIRGLDANFDEQDEVVSLVGNGTSLATTNTFLRVNRCVVIQAGTLRGSNFNNLDIRASGGGVIVAEIRGVGATGQFNYGFGISQLGLYTIPRGKNFIVQSFLVNVSGGKAVTINVFGISNPTTLGSAKNLLFTLDQLEGGFNSGKDVFDLVPEMTDIWVSGFTSTSTSAVDIRLYYKLVDIPPF